MNFNSRETYFAAITDWRIRYNKAIALIRKLKVDYKNGQRELSKVGSNYSSFKKEQWDAHRAATTAMYNAQCDLTEARAVVAALQIERADSRIEADRQYQESRAKMTA